MIKHWISALRLRTLPLAVSSMTMGAIAAAHNGFINIQIFIWSLVTAVLLQILSNLANDYGDSQHGADNAMRTGPKRAVQAGYISPQAMKIAIIVFTLLTLCSGIALLYISFGKPDSNFMLMLLIGLIAIAAAIKYTAGAKPYGYAGLGDVSVFLFFGLAGVAGSYYLYVHDIDAKVLLLSYTMGSLSMAVLNLNNMRDILPDTLAGKKTIPVRIGFENSKYYQYMMLISAYLALFLYTPLLKMPYLVPLLLLLLMRLTEVYKIKVNDAIDPLLKKNALNVLFTVIYFGIIMLCI
ncbi:MAG: 1,4-dihydroxy-2-naphthoate octaprenyltransferase [Cytophagales bacterium]|nr:1,4-dihydroxy-2-naphthoate octaprenyltransferase [Cytophagales bacterium]